LAVATAVTVGCSQGPEGTTDQAVAAGDSSQAGIATTTTETVATAPVSITSHHPVLPTLAPGADDGTGDAASDDDAGSDAGSATGTSEAVATTTSTASATTVQASSTTAAVSAGSFPTNQVVRLGDGANVSLAGVAAGGNQPVLLWFWNPL
jgi:hypothetical protein